MQTPQSELKPQTWLTTSHNISQFSQILAELGTATVLRSPVQLPVLCCFMTTGVRISKGPSFIVVRM